MPATDQPADRDLAGALPGTFGETSVPVAAAHDVALLDLDGVVYIGPDAVPGAAASLDDALARHGLRAAFVTNNAARPPAVVAEHLTSLGIRASAADVVTSAQAGARVLAERFPAGSRVLAVGGPGVPWALEERGLVPVFSADDRPVGVLQGYGPEVGWRALAEVSLALAAGAFWVASNLDRTIPSPRGRVLGNGALVAAVAYAAQVQPLAAGKPEPPLMRESVDRTAARAPLVVGDRLDTDIEGANRSGIPSMLVLTGVSDWPDLLDAPANWRPTYLSADLSGLLTPAPSVRVTRTGETLTAECGRARVSAPTRPRDPQGPEQAVVSPPDPAWWVPPELPTTGSTARTPDLDLVRAVVALSWAAMDRSLVISGIAHHDAA